VSPHSINLVGAHNMSAQICEQFSARPMPDIVFPAFCDHCIAANTTHAPEAGLSFSTFSFNDSEFEFHLFFLSMANRLLEAVCFETQG